MRLVTTLTAFLVNHSFNYHTVKIEFIIHVVEIGKHYFRNLGL